MILPKITESELSFYFSWVTPKNFVEILFSDFDHLNVFEEDKFSYIRLYQEPFLSDEPLIDFEATAKYHNLTKKEEFQLRKNVGDVYCFCARKIGKCEYEENICTLSNGRQVKFKNLIGQSCKVISLNNKTWKLEESQADFFNNGIKSCYKLITQSGKAITVTGNHPFLTAKGWKEIKDLKKGEYIATPRFVPVKSKKEVDKNIAILLGYLIGDGSCTGQIGITNINKEIITEIYELADYFKCSIRKEKITYYFRNKIRTINKNKIEEIVLKYQINKLSKNKQIPLEVYKWSKKNIALLLNRLFACDSHINYKFKNIEICLASKKLIYQIQHLLLRFGIHSNIYYKKTKLKGNFFDAWRLIIGQGIDFNKFLDKIGIKSKDKQIRQKNRYSTSDRIPKELFIKFYELFSKKKRRLNIRSSKQYNFSRMTWQSLSKEIESENFNKIAYSDIYWEQIQKIQYVGRLPTVGVQVSDNHNYISNNIISHNTMALEKLDLLISMLHLDRGDCLFASIDQIHLREVLDKVRIAMDNHPICKLYKNRITGAPDYKYELKNDFVLNSINFNLSGKNPGQQFIGKHTKRLYGEEFSLETEEVYEKRKDSLSEYGAVMRISGMTNFTKHSPAGKSFFDVDNKNKIINLPQFVNPLWDEKEKKDRIKQYGDKETAAYKIFVLGEVIEDGVSVFDIKRIDKHCYDRKTEIKSFEIGKDTFPLFKEMIVVERPKNAKRIFISSDIGESAGTHIIIHSEITENKYNYLYRISLYNLIHDEQLEIFEFLINTLQAEVIGLDNGDAFGRILSDHLEKKYSTNNIVRYQGAAKIDVDTENDENGKVILKKGKPVYRQEKMSVWSVNRLKHILYEGKVHIPMDYLLDTQLNSVIATHTGNQVVYSCVSESDHLFDAWRVFAISVWEKSDSNLTKFKQKNTSCIGYCNWM